MPHVHVELAGELADGRKVTVPLTWSPRLLRADEEQRANRRLVADGQGIHWPGIDEDLSVEGPLRGTAAPGKPRRAVGCEAEASALRVSRTEAGS